MPNPLPSQRLVAHNTSASIGDALAARIKDPLWFLARQWQTGEFEAENGGRAAVLSLTAREFPIDTLLLPDRTRVALDAESLLDVAVERETNGSSAVWNSEALEYRFGVSGGGFELSATDYAGRGLDWYHFDVQRSSALPAPPATVETRMVPTTLSFRGAPHPRWWRFEDGDDYFDSPVDPEPNALSTILPEFSFIDINNWYLAPLPQTAGTIRELTRVEVVDSFGITTTVGPSTGTGDPEWSMFELAAAGSDRTAGGAFLYVPGVAIEVLDNDDVEDVVFTRDEDSNLVWAHERPLASAEGSSAPGTPPATVPVTMREFRLRSDLPPQFIPYVPRFERLTATTGDTYLRRARTVESASLSAPQYTGRIVAESWRLAESEIPRAGVRVRRTHRFARGSDGTAYFWIGRQKQVAPRSAAPTLRFDFVEEPPR